MSISYPFCLSRRRYVDANMTLLTPVTAKRSAAPNQKVAPVPCPLIVDLDHTLVRTDMLHETLIDIAFRRPTQLLNVLFALRRGRASLKRTAAIAGNVDYASLPYEGAVVQTIMGRRDAGGEIHLVTAADQSIADGVAEALGCFDSATGSDGSSNLKGPTKAALIAGRFPDGFDYVGDSAADLPIWRQARGATVVGGSTALLRRIQREKIPVDTIEQRELSLKGWAKLLRLHQWSKNLLLFLPPVLSHDIFDPSVAVFSLLAFLLFGLVASSTYIINDLSDLQADRLHATKRKRALASGRIRISTALCVAAAMLGIGLSGALWASIGLGITCLCYLVLTLAYSFVLKREPLIDVMTIAMLFGLRILAGMMVIDRPISLWLITFTIILFLSLALAKRTAELVQAARSKRMVHGRGYQPGDEVLTLSLGVSAGLTSVVLMVVYFAVDAVPATLYSAQTPLFLIPAILCLWIMRIWIRAHRGTLNDDPILFALRDRGSWLHAVACVGCWTAALTFHG